MMKGVPMYHCKGIDHETEIGSGLQVGRFDVRDPAHPVPSMRIISNADVPDQSPMAPGNQTDWSQVRLRDD